MGRGDAKWLERLIFMKTFPQSGFDELYNASIGATALPPPPPPGDPTDGRLHLHTTSISGLDFGVASASASSGDARPLIPD